MYGHHSSSIECMHTVLDGNCGQHGGVSKCWKRNKTTEGPSEGFLSEVILTLYFTACLEIYYASLCFRVFQVHCC